MKIKSFTASDTSILCKIFKKYNFESKNVMHLACDEIAKIIGIKYKPGMKKETKEKHKKIISLYKQNNIVSKISEIVGVSETSIRKVLRKNNLLSKSIRFDYFKQRDVYILYNFYVDNVNASELAKKYNISRTRVIQITKIHKIRIAIIKNYLEKFNNKYLIYLNNNKAEILKIILVNRAQTDDLGVYNKRRIIANGEAEFKD